jgi:hypothetical protein
MADKEQLRILKEQGSRSRGSHGAELQRPQPLAPEAG